MSDRHIVQKKFNSLLEDYRSEILPTIISDWNNLSSAEQYQLSSLNNFFCGMHVLVGLADTAFSTLLQCMGECAFLDILFAFRNVVNGWYTPLCSFACLPMALHVVKRTMPDSDFA